MKEMVPHRESPFDDRNGDVTEPGCLGCLIGVFTIALFGAMLIAMVIL